MNSDECLLALRRALPEEDARTLEAWLLISEGRRDRCRTSGTETCSGS